MKAIIDTSSLLALVRYYLPFDSHRILFSFIQNKIENGEIVVIDKVLDQCKYVASGLVLKVFTCLADNVFLKSAKVPYNTTSLLVHNPKEFYPRFYTDFCNLPVKKAKRLTDAEFEVQKDRFLEDADMKLIVLCLNLIKGGEKEVILVTEETSTNNDNKLFKKIPAICEYLDIETISLPELLEVYATELNIKYSRIALPPPVAALSKLF